MSGPALIVMAAGIGSRYGGLKQIDPIGPHGEIIIDYSLYDALRAGFEQVVFVIRREIEAALREKVGRAVEQRAQVNYVVQDINDVPPGFHLPAARTKPWGTGHAVLSCRDVIQTPFAVINADDFYGAHSFQELVGFLKNAHDQQGVGDYCMIGYRLRNTLSEFGSVSRGICEITPQGYLKTVNELTRIVKDGKDAKYTQDGEHWRPLSGDATVSLNMFGFTPGFFKALEARFPLFLDQNEENILKAEFFLPEEVNALLQQGKARVKVIPTPDRWYGVTNREDRAAVQAALREMVEAGAYPRDLWEHPA